MHPPLAASQVVAMLQENALNIYTDGSSLPTPRRGGFAFKFVYVDGLGNEVAEDVPVYESYPGATNNQMELLAVICAIEEAPASTFYGHARKIQILTDSIYVYKNYQNAMFRWPNAKWMTRDGNPVANADLWKRFVRRIRDSPKRIDIDWVKGHSRDRNNRDVDRMAKQSARSPLKANPLSVVKVRRKETDRKTERGSVEMRGQRIKIRVITDEYLRTQKLYKYRYEVISKASKYFGYVDVAYSELQLNAGHRYLVTFNTTTRTPRIKKFIREIENT